MGWVCNIFIGIFARDFESKKVSFSVWAAGDFEIKRFD